VALVDRAELVRRAEALGHTALRVYPSVSGRRYICECACGWGAFRAGKATVTRATEAEAVRSLQHHLWRALENDRRERVANGGVSLPTDVARL
jgi:hypothetical protein